MLKLDIEGAEYEVLHALGQGNIRPNVICVEFDELSTPLDYRFFGRVRSSVRGLEQLGYVLVGAESSNAVFVRAARSAQADYAKRVLGEAAQ